MSLEIRSIGEVISYQATSRTEFVVGMGVVKSKTSKNESITFTIIQFIPVDAEDTCYVTSLVPKNVVYSTGLSQGGFVSAPTLEKFLWIQ